MCAGRVAEAETPKEVRACLELYADGGGGDLVVQYSEQYSTRVVMCV